MAVDHGRPEANRAQLLALIRQSAAGGARLVVTPELALSGYVFRHRDHVLPLAETLEGITLTAVRRLAAELDLWICLGLALETRPSGMLTNSAVMVDPRGEVVRRYDKINAESRWACPGDPRRDNTFDTPWGRMGVLICSDVYYGLMPRVTALRGADLLLVPATWPPAGLDPVELWRVRALENGLYLAACNRTGREAGLDCRAAASCCCDPRGNVLLEERRDDARIFHVHIPLNDRGRMEDGERRRRISARRPQDYHDCYRNLRAIEDLTDFFALPQPGPLTVRALVPSPGRHPIDLLMEQIRKQPPQGPQLYLLPGAPLCDAAREPLQRAVGDSETVVITCGGDDPAAPLFSCPAGCEAPGQWTSASLPAFLDIGPARIHLLPFARLAHPETAVAAAKQGCDLIVSQHPALTAEARLLAGARTIEGPAIAVAGAGGAGIWCPPEGHQRWGEAWAEAGQICTRVLDTRPMRTRRFQDNIDFEVLLRAQ
jgi:predicted amidohydrolase